MYSLRFLKSFREEQSLVKEVDKILPASKKKSNRKCQQVPMKNPHNQKEEDQYCIAIIPEEETGLSKLWVRIPEDRKVDEEEDIVLGKDVVVISSSLEMLTKSCLGRMMVSLIFLEGLEEEA
nr:hypothetical protein [Tanacetum cinerariifolium]